eukprot:CAMPEP_0115888622 /NCGR_PEP_ID=MMETSP0287-20121206/32402_1 /TAXON_ID=412157 /ORGANISM="Chrysochromulina rotalis, Strain UIO044" /LENGTH=285 /DNA_ID=CAMNT_0003345311 /DNA_START=314 /DNA_END=1169 /DNA_ORIENTATION=-
MRYGLLLYRRTLSQGRSTTVDGRPSPSPTEASPAEAVAAWRLTGAQRSRDVGEIVDSKRAEGGGRGRLAMLALALQDLLNQIVRVSSGPSSSPPSSSSSSTGIEAIRDELDRLVGRWIVELDAAADALTQCSRKPHAVDVKAPELNLPVTATREDEPVPFDIINRGEAGVVGAPVRKLDDVVLLVKPCRVDEVGDVPHLDVARAVARVEKRVGVFRGDRYDALVVFVARGHLPDQAAVLDVPEAQLAVRRRRDERLRPPLKEEHLPHRALVDVELFDVWDRKLKL